MTTTTFDTFLDEERAVASPPAVDWVARKARWLQALEDFYSRVDGFLQPYIAQGKLSLTYDDITLEEDALGRYPARRARIQIGPHALRLEPIGTNLIAAQGRVDLVGPCGVVKFVLVDAAAAGPRIAVSLRVGDTPEPPQDTRPAPEWVWRIATEAPSIRYLPLEAESFYDAIMQVTQG